LAEKKGNEVCHLISSRSEGSQEWKWEEKGCCCGPVGAASSHQSTVEPVGTNMGKGYVSLNKGWLFFWEKQEQL